MYIITLLMPLFKARSLKRTAGGDNILTSKRPRLGMRGVTETDGADSGVSGKGGFYFLAFQALLDLFTYILAART